MLWTSNQINRCAHFGLTNSEQAVARTANTGLAKVAVQCSADSFVVIECSVLRIKISSKNPAHRKSARRYVQPY